jgi:murein DD-endopeptidase MepM/ murein hydrolase activator NlpD
MRKHPVLGYSKMHTGIDFAAPIGTPIYAAGDGQITRRGLNGGYGNYIQIKHNGTMSTAYGHMSKFDPNFKVGSRVKQGQVIGYVGETGVATGPHLHYEIIMNDQKVNPATVTLPNKTSLSEDSYKEFKRQVYGIKNKLGQLFVPTKKPANIVI